MSQILKLELSQQTFDLLVRQAAKEGQSPEQWAAGRLRAALPTAEDYAAAMARLMRHAGAVDLGKPSGIDNEQIDQELAQAYSDTHEPQD